MTDLAIEHEVLIDAPVDVVWRTITQPDQISQWFADRVELELRSGGAGTFMFEDKATTHATTAPLVVETVVAPERFSFRWGHPEGEEPVPGNSVLVEFTLTEEGGSHTRLRVVESGLDLIGWTEDEKAHYVEDHRNGWATHLGRLENLFATAAG